LISHLLERIAGRSDNECRTPKDKKSLNFTIRNFLFDIRHFFPLENAFFN